MSVGSADQWDWNYPIIFSVGLLGSNLGPPPTDTYIPPPDPNFLGLDQRQPPPGFPESEAWNAIYPNLTAQLGATWDDYVQKLDADAQYLFSLGENVTDIGQLFGFEVQQANGYSPLVSLASATDAQVAAPGLPLSFSRTFAPGSSSGTSSAASVGAGPTPGTLTSLSIPTDR